MVDEHGDAAASLEMDADDFRLAVQDAVEDALLSIGVLVLGFVLTGAFLIAGVQSLVGGPGPVPELDGLIADKEKFNNVVLNDELRPLYYVETMLKLEALECTRYERVIGLARSLDDETGEAVADAIAPNYEHACDVRTELESLADGAAVDRLLAASQIDDADRASLDPYQ